MLISVLIIAVFWEIYELVFKVTFLHKVGYWQSSLSDISNSLVGGILAFLYFIKNKKAKCSVADISKEFKHSFAITL